MGRKIKGLLLTFVLCLQVLVPATKAKAAAVLYDSMSGREGGYNYELWKDHGNTSMTLKGEGLFECQWDNIGNALFRKGIKYDCTKTYSQIGNITVNYGVDYRPNGNSYLCVYGWCRQPLVEYYIVDSWGTWRPPGAASKGTITVDGGIYDVYETTRVNQPSIDGNTTFQQYWSVRRDKRTGGTISVTEHFKEWERMGMKMGLIYEAALTVEGYQSSGWADVYKLDITVGGKVAEDNNNAGGDNNAGSNNGGNNNGGNNAGGNVSGNGNNGSSAPGTNKGTEIECESMTKAGPYIGNIDKPFQGVALYGNGDSVSTKVNFTSGTHDFSLRGASNGNALAQVDLFIGGEKKGTFYYGDAYVAEYTIKGVSHGTGEQTVELKMTADVGAWDTYADCLIIGGNGVSVGEKSAGGTSDNRDENAGNQGGTADNQSGDTGNKNENTGDQENTGNQSETTGNQSDNTSDKAVNYGPKMECEAMAKAGPYVDYIDQPFKGVALFGNGDEISYTQNFTEGKHDFTLRGASDGFNMARVDLIIGNQKKGTFYYGDANIAEYTISNVSHDTGNQTVKLVITADNGQWDAYVDCLTISPAGSVKTNNGSNAENPENFFYPDWKIIERTIRFMQRLRFMMMQSCRKR